MTIKKAIRERHSVRQYKDIAIKAEDKEKLEASIKECNAESGLHLQLICDEPECFDTLFAHYEVKGEPGRDRRILRGKARARGTDARTEYLLGCGLLR